jgi:hypothetical protein
VRIETPNTIEQTLATQNFVNAWNASDKPMHGVEHGGICIRERSAFG